MPAARSLTCVLIAASSGCFYMDAINERPSAEIVRVGDGEIFRGTELMVRAVVDDPDHDAYHLSWRGQACDGPAGGPGVVCASVGTGVDPLFRFTVPVEVAGRPTLDVYIDLAVEDAHGATARPGQRLELPVGNRRPSAVVQLDGRSIEGQFPPDVPITINALGSDPDGDQVTLRWQLFPATTSRPEDVVFEPAADQPTTGEAYTLIPDVEGEWTVRVTADDGLETHDLDTPILVRPDHAPCLGATEPATGSTVLATGLRRFAVLVVADDLDVWPAPAPGDPFLGPARFAWSLRGPGAAAFTPISDAAAVDFDPAAWAPGDRVELRVEIDDRVGRSLAACGDAPTCSVEVPASCLQRRTWTVEVR